MAVADRNGLPVAVCVESATPHEVKLVIPTLSPYDQVIKIVRQVTEDGVIRGTWQYRLTPCAVLFIFFYLQVEIQPSCADTSATV
jgi:hypothetical protein